MGIKSFSIHKIIQNHLNKPDLLKDNIPSSIRKMGILLDHQDLNIFNPKEFFKDELDLTPENIKIFIYFDKIDPRENLLIDAFSSKDFGILGAIKNEGIQQFLENEMDLLINYCNAENELAQYLVLKSNAKLVAGFSDNQMFQQISIDVDRNQKDHFNQELIKYLRKLQLI